MFANDPNIFNWSDGSQGSPLQATWLDLRRVGTDYSWGDVMFSFVFCVCSTVCMGHPFNKNLFLWTPRNPRSMVKPPKVPIRSARWGLPVAQDVQHCTAQQCATVGVAWLEEWGSRPATLDMTPLGKVRARCCPWWCVWCSTNVPPSPASDVGSAPGPRVDGPMMTDNAAGAEAGMAAAWVCMTDEAKSKDTIYSCRQIWTPIRYLLRITSKVIHFRAPCQCFGGCCNYRKFLGKSRLADVNGAQDIFLVPEQF